MSQNPQGDRPNNVLRYYQSVSNNTAAITVPDNEKWKILWCNILYVSDATVGNRTMFLDSYSVSSTIFVSGAGAAQAASQTVAYQFVSGILRETAVTNLTILSPIPQDYYLYEADTISFYDLYAISSGDTMEVSFEYEKL